MNTDNINFSIVNKIGVITVSRPKALNALNQQTLTELLNILAQVQKLILQGDIRLVVLTGSQENKKVPSFIAGADIKELASLDISQAHLVSKLGQDVTLSIESLHAPVIAAVDGYALGGGLEMALSCDFIWCTKNSQFGLPEVKLGLIPGFGGTQRLFRSIGVQAAKELTFSGNIIASDEGFRLGLVQKIYNNYEDLFKAINLYAKDLEHCGPQAVAMVKNVITKGCDKELSQGLELEAQQFSSLFAHQDPALGIEAFLEKKIPKFQKEITII